MARAPRKPDVLRTIEDLGRGGQALAPAPSAYVQLRKASGTLALTEAFTDVPGCSFTTPFASNWDVRSYVDIESAASFLFWIMLVNGVQPANGGEGHTNVTGRLSLAMEYTTGYVAKGSIIKLQGKRSGGAGTIYSGHTRMVVERCL